MLRAITAYLDFTKFSGEKKRHFVTNVLIGILIALGFHYIEQTKLGESIIDTALDEIIVREAKGSSGTRGDNKDISSRLLFVDMADSGYTQCRDMRPLIQPRDRLADIIRYAYRGNASVVIIDILLEDADCCCPAADDMLRSVFDDMVRNNSKTKVIMAGRARRWGVVNNLFEYLLRDGKGMFFLGSPFISAPTTDRMNRYMVPYEVIRSGDGVQDIVLNVSPMAALLADGKGLELGVLKKEIMEYELKNRQKEDKSGKTMPIELSGGRKLYITAGRNDVFHNRIRFFVMPPNSPDDPGIGTRFIPLSRFKKIDDVMFKDKIVIIGNSDPYLGDIHQTPVGEMPGMYVIGNVLNTLLTGRQPSHTPIWANILAEMFVIIMAAYLYLHFHSVVANVIGMAIVVVILGGLSYWWFVKTGVFLNFAFAAAGMGVQSNLNALEDMIRHRGKREHRY